ncbi:hypothetical protein [Burkholderia sp. HI2500]|uniref:hypothetical protein n=1 Tax=Burkholderia sp. HI2500 TaxID=2015358 RepID=UPI0027955D99|nr:hypothetical protein [Burkholderia sp. HI2500]
MPSRLNPHRIERTIMGLTITAYCGLEALDAPRLDGNREPVDVFTVRLYWAPRFPQRADGLDIARVFRYRNAFEFAVGTYITHEIFREQLAELANYPAIPMGGKKICHTNGAIAESSGPFKELIDFSTTMGTIGPRTARKLADDFSRFMHLVDAERNPLFAELYRNWYVAFALAQHDGAVRFH